MAEREPAGGVGPIRPAPAVGSFAWPRSGPDRSMWRYRDRLPIAPDAEAVTLGEGGTPLIRSLLFNRFSLVWKDEGRNPTGSHKDRALSLAATHARLVGARVMVVVSAGSTGLSNAAYAARAGVASVTLMGGDAPPERVYPAYALGSRLIRVEAGIDDVIEAVRLLSGRDGIYVASTTRASNPVQAEAAKTIAYEIVADLRKAPDWIVVPTGGGGTIAGIWHGFKELLEAGIVDHTPRLVAVVPAGYDALRHAFAEGIQDPEAYFALPYRDDVVTVLTKLAHAHPPDGLEALDAIRRTDGRVLPFGDEAAIDAVRRIGGVDGLYMEPSSAVALPAVESLVQEDQIRPGDTVVALACGSGFRETFVMKSARPMRIDQASLTDLDAAIRRSLIV